VQQACGADSLENQQKKPADIASLPMALRIYKQIKGMLASEGGPFFPVAVFLEMTDNGTLGPFLSYLMEAQ
jgi:hypothetical protein